MTEYLKNIAIIGASGSIGKPTLDALIRQGRHAITVITRTSSKAGFPEHPAVSVKRGDYNNDDFMQATLHGQDVLIIMLAFAGWPEEQTILMAAAKAGVEYVLPTSYGSDISDPRMRETVPLCKTMYDNHMKIQQLGLTFISIVTGPWFDYILETGMVGFDIAQRKATVYSEGGYFITTTTAKAGAGIAAMLALPRATIDEKFANNWLYVSSFRVTHEELFAGLLRATGTLESDWSVHRKPAQALLEGGKRKLQDGDRSGSFDVLLGANYCVGHGGDYAEKVQNAMFQIPDEDMEEVIREIAKKIAS